MPTDKLDLIYERWKASLKNKDRSRQYVESNFEELWNDFRKADATIEEARSYLADAIKVHLPAPALTKFTWRTARNNPLNRDKSEKEWVDDWNKDIADKATNSLYDTFPLPVDDDVDPDPKVYGQMSAREYKLQRRQAESYPVLDVEALERKIKAAINSTVKGDDDGESK